MTPSNEWPNEISELMTECWAANPDNRPTFAGIHARIEAIWHKHATRARELTQTGTIQAVSRVAVYEDGYVQVPSTDYYNNSKQSSSNNDNGNNNNNNNDSNNSSRSSSNAGEYANAQPYNKY